MFCYTSWHFYVFSRTNLLTRCNSASSLFSAVFVFQKSYTEIFSELDETKAEPPIFPEASRSPKMRRRGGRAWPHPRVAWPRPWPCHLGVRLAGPPPDIAVPPIYSPRREKPKQPDQFSRNTSRAAAAVDPRLGGSRTSRHPAGGLLHCHAYLRSDAWVVYLGLRVHSSN
jgi:hypothetical protein